MLFPVLGADANDDEVMALCSHQKSRFQDSGITFGKGRIVGEHLPFVSDLISILEAAQL